MKRSKATTILSHQAWLILPTALLLSCSQPARSPAALAPSPSPSPAVGMMGPPGMSTPIIGKPYPGTGVVTIINLKEGWIEINHEPIEGLMPAMEMEWTVEPRSLMKSIHVGDKVNFTVVETGKGEIITSLKTVPAR